MHSGAINREYKFKFYLNANHYIIIDGKEGEQHPHTWEFMVHIRMNGQKFVQFDAYEKAIDEYFNQYQNHLINEIEPFDHIIPTLEICMIILCVRSKRSYKIWMENLSEWRVVRHRREVM